MLVFFNGKVVNEEDAKINIGDLSYQFGFGLFETIKCLEGFPLFFEAHYKRITHSAKELEMPFPVELKEVKNWIIELLKKNNLKSARVKIIISKRNEGEKFNVLIIPSPLGALPASYSLIAQVLNRDANSISYRHKTTSRADSYFHFKKAIESGYSDVLYLNDKNELVECSRANIFLVLEDRIITPKLQSGILSGVTRDLVFNIVKKNQNHIEEKNVHSLYFNKALGVFVTSAIVGLMPVSRIKLEEKEFNFYENKTIKKFQTLYLNEINNYLNKEKVY